MGQEAEGGVVRYLSNFYHVQNREKSLFYASNTNPRLKSNLRAISITTRASNSL